MHKRNKLIIAILVVLCVLFFSIVVKKIRYFNDENTMKQIVIKEIPDILNKNSSDFEKLNMIREWVNEQTVWSKKPVDNNLRFSVNEKTSLEMYTLFKSKEVALDCATYTVFLHEIYQLFGYEGYIYDMGNEHQFRHSVVLVWMNDNGKRKLIVEDPSYNLTYVNKNNAPIDFIELLKLIKGKKTSEITILNGGGKGHWNKDGAVVVRERFDTEIIKNNLSSFLYCKNVRYYEKIRNLHSLIRPIDTFLFKKKIQIIIGNNVDTKEYGEDDWIMKNIIIKAIPKVLSTSISDFERVNMIREWVNEQTVWGTMPDDKLDTMINAKTSLGMYNYYLTHTDRAYGCGSYSVYLLKVYQLFGYEAYVYDMGRDNQFRHSVLLVWIKDGKERKLVIQDPSYNLTYVDRKNRPLDYFQFIDYLKKNKENIVIKKSTGKGHKMIRENPHGTVLVRNHFDTRIIKENLSSFLYIRDIRYFNVKLKAKLCSAVECAPKCKDIPMYMINGQFSMIKQAVLSSCIKN